MQFSYRIAATGLDSLALAPLPGTMLAGRASFGITSDDFAALPNLRRWVRDSGGTVVSESGTPAPADAIEPSDLYAVSLGPSTAIEVEGLTRDRQPCAECGLAVIRISASDQVSSRRRAPARAITSTRRATWIAEHRIVDELRANSLSAGLSTLSIAMSNGEREALWPDRLLASSRDVGVAGVRRCATCLRLIDPENPAAEWVPRYSLGLFVEPPAQSAGWWWHARVGQSLPIVSGEVVTLLRRMAKGVSALPVITRVADAFLPEEYRG